MTELSFLVDLLLNHKLPKATRDAVASRIKEVESNFTAPKIIGVPSPASFVTNQIGGSSIHAQQAASTLAAMARHADPSLVIAPPPEMPPIPATPVTVIAQTPAAAAAMNSRNQAISDSINGKTDKLTGRPRKF